MSVYPVEYSTLSADRLLQLVINNYETGPQATITYLKRGFNDTYLIRCVQCNYIFRVYKHKWRSEESIETELTLLIYLKENGISVSYPIQDKQDKYIQCINTPEGPR